MIPTTSAIWMIAPILLKKINPSNHKTRIIIPIINKILMLPPVIY
jgi:hypothetical protein